MTKTCGAAILKITMDLTVEQLRHFDEEGYVIVQQALRDSDLEPVIDEIEAFVDRRADELFAEGLISDLQKHGSFERRLALITMENTAIYDGMDIMHFRGEALFRFLRNEKLMDVVENLVGPEITCSPIQHLRAKLPNELIRPEMGTSDQLASRVNENVAPWHQDIQVHLKEADPSFILTVWIPLCDTDERNGCLQIVPRIHKERVIYWSEGFGIADEAINKEDILSVPMQKGDVLLMHKLIPHRSIANQTDTIRWSMDLRYQKTGTPTGRSFYPDFVTRSRANPELVLTDHGTWSRWWEEAVKATATNKRPGRENRPTEPTPIKVVGN